MPLTLDSLRKIAGPLRALCMLTLAALFALKGRADTLAYWNNDLTAGTTRGGWTLSAGTGAKILGGTATTEAQINGVGHEGLVLKRTAPFAGDTFTLVVKYSALAVGDSNQKWALASFFGGDSVVSFESVLYSQKNYCWMGNRFHQDQFVGHEPPVSGLMAVVFSRSSGTRVLFQNIASSKFALGEQPTDQSVMGANGLSRIQIGGCSSDISDADGATLQFCRPSMTIEGVAILDEEITEGSTYDFPPYAEEKSSVWPYYLPGLELPILNDVQFEDLLRGTVTARINGAAVSSAHQDEVLTAMSVKAVRGHEALTEVELQFQLKDEDAARAVIVECKALANRNVGVRVKKLAQAEVWQYGEDASSWAEIKDTTSILSTFPEKFGLHDLKLMLPYGRVTTISGPTQWAATGIGEDAAGTQTLVLVKEGATISFDERSIPSSIHFDAKEPAEEIVVANVLPALTARCPLVIPPDTTVTACPEYAGTIIVRGCCSMANPDRAEGVLPSLVLDGGTIVNGTSDLELVTTEETVLTLKADATIDCAHAFSGRQTGSAKTVLSFNDHTLTKTGTERFLLDGVRLVDGGAINVREGVMELSGLGMSPDATQISLTVSVEDDADLSLKRGTWEPLRLHVNLVKGSFTATDWNLDVTVPAGATLVRHLDGELIRYCFAYLTPRTEPGTVTATDWFLEGFTIGEGEDLRETPLIPGDTVILPATLPDESSRYADKPWTGYAKLSGHPIIACQNLVWNMDVNRLTIADGVRVTMRQQGLHLIDGAYVDGAGTLEVSSQDVWISGHVTVACSMTGTGALYLRAGSTLTCAPDVGVRLESAVENERVIYDEEKGQYRLVYRGMPLEPGQTLTVKADSAAAAAAQAYLKLRDVDAVHHGQEALLKIVAKETAEGTGVWTLSAEIDETKIVPLDEVLRAFAEQALPDLAGTDREWFVIVRANVTPGLYYSLEMASDAAFTRDCVRTQREMCSSNRALGFHVPARTGKSAFFRLTAHMTKE